MIAKVQMAAMRCMCGRNLVRYLKLIVDQKFKDTKTDISLNDSEPMRMRVRRDFWEHEEQSD